MFMLGYVKYVNFCLVVSGYGKDILIYKGSYLCKNGSDGYKVRVERKAFVLNFDSMWIVYEVNCKRKSMGFRIRGEYSPNIDENNLAMHGSYSYPGLIVISFLYHT